MENITSYEWNLGSANNGWLYNGNPAPQYISTTASSLSLTSIDNATTVNNVGVTIKVNNLTFKSYTSTVTRSTLVPTITGLPQTCTSEDYNITILPAGATVTWSIIPAYGRSNLTTSGNTATLTKTGDGNVVLSAVVSSTACGSTSAVPKTIAVGLAAFPPYTTYPSYICDQTPFDFIPDLPAGVTITKIEGQLGGTYQDLLPSSNYGYEVPVGIYRVRLTLQNDCGTSTPFKMFQRADCEGPIYRPAYPNPANAELVIEVKAKSSDEFTDGDSSTDNYILYDEKGEKIPLKIKKEEKFRKTFDTEDIPNGTYYLHITEGKETTKQQIIIKH